MGYSRVVTSLTALTWRGVSFEWSKRAEEAFQNLQTTFTTARVFRLFDPDRPSIVERDASDYFSAGILSQNYYQRGLHPVVYFCMTHIPAGCNYEIYDKVFLAVIQCFKEWSAHLEGSPEPTVVLTDH